MNSMDLMRVTQIDRRVTVWIEGENVRYTTATTYTDNEGVEFCVTVYSEKHPDSITTNQLEQRQ